MTLTSDIFHQTSDIIHLLSFTAEGEASDPIRNSLYERECSMWGPPEPSPQAPKIRLIRIIRVRL